MTVLTDAATEAFQAAKAAQEAARDEERKAFRDGVKTAVGAVIAPLTWAESGLAYEHVDLQDRIAIVTDGTIYLAVHDTAEGWKVRLASLIDGQWTRGSQVTNLAELGASLVRTSS